MCGIVGIYSHDDTAYELYESLIHLQHRGQDAAGILTCNNRFYSKHGKGLVREIFNPDNLSRLRGRMGIAHTRYPTSGSYNDNDIQPLWIGSPRGIALAHNGNLVNDHALRDYIRNKQHRHLNTDSDSESLLLSFADEISKFKNDEDEGQFFECLRTALSELFRKLEGSYAVVSMVIGKGMIAFRDPHGIRPLVLGERLREDGRKDYIFASENTPFYALNFEPKGDLAPGEVIYISDKGNLYRGLVQKKIFKPCVFEYVYFARPDATLDGVSVYRARLRMGQNLATAWKKTYPDQLPDVVIPAPFTANTAALSFAHELNVRYSEGLYKNPFIGRTFIMPSQKTRTRHVRYKLTPQRTEIENKAVLIVDDSIVRGTTSREIVRMVREFGAKNIYFVSSSPPILNPCFYGIDMPTRNELIAAKQTLEEVRVYLGVDKLLYQQKADLIEAVTRRGNHQIESPCMACMGGEYISGEITEEKMQHLERLRQEKKRNVDEH